MCVRRLLNQSPLILFHHGSGPYCVISCLSISVHLLFKALTLVFALFGIFIGAISGVFSDSTVNGVFRRIVLGAIVGAVAFVETLKSWQVYWTLEHSPSDSIPLMTGFLRDLISGRLVYEFLIPAVSGAQQWQLNIREMTYEDIFEALLPLSSDYAVAGGAPLELLSSLPKHEISQAEELDSNGEPQCCSICLQEFQRGETARSLPKCSHSFHLSCVDQWLVKHALCPLCRQYV